MASSKEDVNGVHYLAWTFCVCGWLKIELIFTAIEQMKRVNGFLREFQYLENVLIFFIIDPFCTLQRLKQGEVIMSAH